MTLLRIESYRWNLQSHDFGEPFVKATYNLEGDGPLALNAYEEITKLNAVISTQHFPNTS